MGGKSRFIEGLAGFSVVETRPQFFLKLTRALSQAGLPYFPDYGKLAGVG
jgi:hypothetical protein